MSALFTHPISHVWGCSVLFLYISCKDIQSAPLTWSQRAICLSFQREVPVVTSIFMFPRTNTLLALCVLLLPSCKSRRQYVQRVSQNESRVIHFWACQCTLRNNSCILCIFVGLLGKAFICYPLMYSASWKRGGKCKKRPQVVLEMRQETVFTH